MAAFVAALCLLLAPGAPVHGAEEGAPAVGPGELGAVVPTKEESGSRAGRIAVQAVVGSLGVVLGGALGIALGLGLADGNRSDEDAYAISGGALGAAASAAVTTYTVGKLMDGNGSLLTTSLARLLGGVGAAGMSLWIFETTDEGGLWAASLVGGAALILTSSIVGYEMTSDASARQAGAGGGRGPKIAPGWIRGGPALMLGWRFW